MRFLSQDSPTANSSFGPPLPAGPDDDGINSTFPPPGQGFNATSPRWSPSPFPSPAVSPPHAPPPPVPPPPVYENLFGVQNVVTDSSVLTTMWAWAILGVLCIVGFALVHKRWIFYKIRLYLDSVSVPPPALSTKYKFSIIAWIVNILSVNDLQLLATAGLDALMLVRVVSLGIKMFIPFTFIGLVILVPVHRFGIEPADPKKVPLSAYTMANIPEGSNTFWLHVVFCYLYTFYIMALLRWQYFNYVKLRQHYMVAGNDVNYWRQVVSGSSFNKQQQYNNLLNALEMVRDWKKTLSSSSEEVPQPTLRGRTTSDYSTVDAEDIHTSLPASRDSSYLTQAVRNALSPMTARVGRAVSFGRSNPTAAPTPQVMSSPASITTAHPGAQPSPLPAHLYPTATPFPSPHLGAGTQLPSPAFPPPPTPATGRRSPGRGSFGGLPSPYPAPQPAPPGPMDILSSNASSDFLRDITIMDSGATSGMSSHYRHKHNPTLTSIASGDESMSPTSSSLSQITATSIAAHEQGRQAQAAGSARKADALQRATSGPVAEGDEGPVKTPKKVARSTSLPVAPKEYLETKNTLERHTARDHAATSLPSGPLYKGVSGSREAFRYGSVEGAKWWTRVLVHPSTSNGKEQGKGQQAEGEEAIEGEEVDERVLRGLLSKPSVRHRTTINTISRNCSIVSVNAAQYAVLVTDVPSENHSEKQQTVKRRNRFGLLERAVARLPPFLATPLLRYIFLIDVQRDELRSLLAQADEQNDKIVRLEHESTTRALNTMVNDDNESIRSAMRRYSELRSPSQAISRSGVSRSLMSGSTGRAPSLIMSTNQIYGRASSTSLAYHTPRDSSWTPRDSLASSTGVTPRDIMLTSLNTRDQLASIITTRDPTMAITAASINPNHALSSQNLPPQPPNPSQANAASAANKQPAPASSAALSTVSSPDFATDNSNEHLLQTTTSTTSTASSAPRPPPLQVPPPLSPPASSVANSVNLSARGTSEAENMELVALSPNPSSPTKGGPCSPSPTGDAGCFSLPCITAANNRAGGSQGQSGVLTAPGQQEASGSNKVWAGGAAATGTTARHHSMGASYQSRQLQQQLLSQNGTPSRRSHSHSGVQAAAKRNMNVLATVPSGVAVDVADLPLPSKKGSNGSRSLLRFHSQLPRKRNSKWDMVRSAIEDGRLFDIPQDIVTRTFARLFPHDFDRAVPVFRFDKVDQLLLKWDFHQRQLEHALALAEMNEGKEPYQHVCCDSCCLCCACCACCSLNREKVPSIQYHTKRIQELEKQVVAAQVEALNSKTHSYIVFFHTQLGATLAANSVLHAEDQTKFQVHAAPGPENVNWEVLWFTFGQREARALASLPVKILVLLFPISMLCGGLTSLDRWACASINVDQPPKPENVPEAQWFYCQKKGFPKILQLIVTALLPSVLLSLWQNMAIPRSLHYVAQMESRCVALSGIDKRILDLYYSWSVLNLIQGVLGQVVVSLLQEVRNNPDKIVTTILESIGKKLPEASNFFMNYVWYRGVCMLPFRLLAPHMGFWCFLIKLGGRCCSVSKRDVVDLYTTRSIRHGIELGLLTYIYLVGLVYCLVSPLLCPVVLMYFMCAFVLWRNSVLYLNVRKYESGGSLWPRFFDRLLWCLLLMALFLGAVLMFKKAYWQGVFLVVTMPFLIKRFHKHCHMTFEMGVKYTPLELAKDAPAASVDPSVYLPPPLQPGCVGWHPEWMKAWEGFGQPMFTA